MLGCIATHAQPNIVVKQLRTMSHSVLHSPRISHDEAERPSRSGEYATTKSEVGSARTRKVEENIQWMKTAISMAERDKGAS